MTISIKNMMQILFILNNKNRISLNPTTRVQPLVCIFLLFFYSKILKTLMVSNSSPPILSHHVHRALHPHHSTKLYQDDSRLALC